METKKYTIACIIGTRPEAIKMAPVVEQLHQHPEIETVLISTGQHREILQKMMDIFDLHFDIDLHLMTDNQTLSRLTGEAAIQLADVLSKKKYDLILAQGDTTTTFVAALTAFYLKIPFGHIEAGLRSHDIHNPFPEEMNRVFISEITRLHFAPTDDERDNLLHENILDYSIFVTGNTVIDALKFILTKNKPFPFPLPKNKKIILLTMHHREIFGEPLKRIFDAILQIANTEKDVFFIYPVHPNPNVKELAYRLLDNHPAIQLMGPLPYDDFVMLMKLSYLIMTDSGGIEEEAPILGKPLIILRDVTERKKVVELGLGILVGSDTEIIVDKVCELLNDPAAYQAMVKNISPYGDGHSAEKIMQIILEFIHHNKGRVNQ